MKVPRSSKLPLVNNRPRQGVNMPSEKKPTKTNNSKPSGRQVFAQPTARPRNTKESIQNKDSMFRNGNCSAQSAFER
jgi:hypothetical protein